MSESRYSKYIVTDVRRDLRLPDFRPDRPGQAPPPGVRSLSNHVVWLDGEVVPGANMYAECVWFWPGPRPALTPEMVKEAKVGPKPHTHPFDEIIGFFGTSLEDPHDLGGEIELWLEDERHILTKSFIAFVPAGMRHCPLAIWRIERPIFHFTLGPGSIYR